MARDLKNSERFGTLLQSKLSKAEVISPCTTSLFHFKFKALCHCQIKVSNRALASRLATRLERISELEGVLKKVLKILTLTLSLTLALTRAMTLGSKSVG